MRISSADALETVSYNSQDVAVASSFTFLEGLVSFHLSNQFEVYLDKLACFF